MNQDIASRGIVKKPSCAKGYGYMGMGENGEEHRVKRKRGMKTWRTFHARLQRVWEVLLYKLLGTGKPGWDTNEGTVALNERTDIFL